MTRPVWDAFSPEGTREATAKILTGRNYRLFYESATRRTLINVYRELADFARKHPTDDEQWRSFIHKLLGGTPRKRKQDSRQMQDKRMRQWLIGLTKKTADNLDIKAADYPAVFDEMMEDIEADEGNHREMALLLWCGAATLTIRGSQKSRIGKSLERVIARAALASIGIEDFRLNVEADREVERETDAEVKTPRGFVRIEVGLIAKGNSEVIGDKVGRMNRNDVILMDQLPPRSTAYRTAENRGVLLVQIRNGHPVEELRKHLASLNVSQVRQEPLTLAEVEQAILDMPLESFAQEQTP